MNHGPFEIKNDLWRERLNRWWTIPPISTKRIMTSELKPLKMEKKNNNKITAYDFQCFLFVWVDIFENASYILIGGKNKDHDKIMYFSNEEQSNPCTEMFY